LHRPWIHRLVDERGVVGTRPRDALLRADGQQQVELLGEQGVVVGQVVAEQREGLGERPSARHDLGTAARQQVQRGELLEHADGIVGAEHADGTGQPDLVGALGRRGKHRGGEEAA
jgi:hypothetical protein